MAREQLKTLTEPMYYVLLALTKSQHGYSIMQTIQDITDGRVQVGAGTLYTLLARFESEEIIKQIAEEDRKKIYALTDKGRDVLSAEFKRLNQMTADGARFFNDDGSVIDQGPFEGEPLLAIDPAFAEDESEAAAGESAGEAGRSRRFKPAFRTGSALV